SPLGVILAGWSLDLGRSTRVASPRGRRPEETGDALHGFPAPGRTAGRDRRDPEAEGGPGGSRSRPRSRPGGLRRDPGPSGPRPARSRRRRPPPVALPVHRTRDAAVPPALPRPPRNPRGVPQPRRTG